MESGKEKGTAKVPIKILLGSTQERGAREKNFKTLQSKALRAERKKTTQRRQVIVVGGPSKGKEGRGRPYGK